MTQREPNQMAALTNDGRRADSTAALMCHAPPPLAPEGRAASSNDSLSNSAPNEPAVAPAAKGSSVSPGGLSPTIGATLLSQWLDPLALPLPRATIAS